MRYFHKISLFETKNLFNLEFFRVFEGVRNAFLDGLIIEDFPKTGIPTDQTL